MSKEAINFDRNASYGLLVEVAGELHRSGLQHLNPSSIHSGGQEARALVEEARERVGILVGASGSDRVVFTSGATEANNMAVSLAREGKAVCSAIEHPSVLEPLRSFGIDVLEIAPLFSPEAFLDACSEETKVVSLMLANNETGVILSVKETASLIRKHYPNTLIHCDAVQAAGKMELVFSELGVDMLTVSSHKIGGLAGTGALVVSERVPTKAFIVGGPQETRWRGGTENVLGVAAFGVAAKLVHSQLVNRIQSMETSTEKFEQLVLNSISEVSFHDFGYQKIPNTLNLHVPGVVADDLVVALDLAGLYVSSGAACASGKPDPSHVLLALGLNEKVARETLRVSLGAEHEQSEIELAAKLLSEQITNMRKVRRSA